mgnify:CR=1 FL=1
MGFRLRGPSVRVSSDEVIDGKTSVERYELLGELATGGMATVYFGRQRGAFGFSRTVAIKSMHPQLAKDPAFRAMFIDEANLTARIKHPNVVPTLDIVASSTKLLIVMEYVEGVSLSVLLRAARAQNRKLPVPVVVAIVRDMLEGLHAAHELTDDAGAPLSVVHRDVSPQNLLVGVDGIARVVDFGVAKATGRSYQTQTGEIRGKVGYMAPEQMFGEAIDRRVDVYASGVVLWEALVTDRLFNAPTDAALILVVMQGTVTPPSLARGERLPEALDQLVRRALSRDPQSRFATAAEMLKELLAIATPASREEVAQVVRELAPVELALRASYLQQRSPSTEVATLEPEAKAILDVLTRATMTRDAPVTGASTAGSSEGGPRRLVFPIAVALAVVTLLVVVSALAVVRRMRPAEAASAAGPPPASAQIVAGPEPNPAPTEEGDVVPAPPLAAPASSEPPPAAAKSAKHGQKRPASKPTPVASSAPTGSHPDCTLPYTTDEAGHRHYKAECLK